MKNRWNNLRNDEAAWETMKQLKSAEENAQIRSLILKNHKASPWLM